MPDPSLAGACAIAVMAKAPRPGHVKTRLQTVLNPDEAARLGGAFLRDVTGNLAAAARHAPIHAYVAYAPAGQESRFDGLLADGTALVLADGSGGDAEGVEGFGRCLLHATRALLDRGYGAACVLNADSPTLPTALLVQAADLLLAPGRRAVLGPAGDGGYWMLGMQSAEPELFARIAWSTDAVGRTTRERAAGLGLALEMLDTWYDVDDRAGLERLVRELDGRPQTTLTPYHAPATAACVAAMGLPQRLPPEDGEGAPVRPGLAGAAKAGPATRAP